MDVAWLCHGPFESGVDPEDILFLLHTKQLLSVTFCDQTVGIVKWDKTGRDRWDANAIRMNRLEGRSNNSHSQLKATSLRSKTKTHFYAFFK